MKASFITTVFNEGKTIEQFLHSLLTQSQKPHEVILVDGGSTDKTVQIAKAFFKKHPVLNGKVFMKKGNRSVGRNEAIRQATHEIILCSDAGCVLDKQWVKNILKPFGKKQTDVVAGYYTSQKSEIFGKSLAPYVLVMPDKVNPKTFLPATRSMAFKKSVWENLGGFNESLSHNEDYAFARKIKEHKYRIVFAEDAIVYWQPRKNLKEAFVMFFRFALGDAEAKILRPKVALIFARYIGIVSLFLLWTVFPKTILLAAVLSLIPLYILWAIVKNYRYVHDPRAFVLLPALQVSADIAVMAGTSFGFLEILRRVIKNNPMIFLVILMYSVTVLSGIEWGIPNTNHPFNYHMDEWAQAQSIRAIFKHGTPNISGASHGAVLFYFLGGIYLMPFILLHIVNPFLIKSSLEHIAEQHRLFEVLRVNTVLWGVGSLILLSYIAKKYLRLNALLTVVLFIISPIWLIESNYYKYDISLIFWLLVSIYFVLRYKENPTKRNFLLLGFVSSLAISTKVSAIPLFPIYVTAFALFTKHWKEKLSLLFQGIGVFVLTFCVFGMPDFFISTKDYLEWFKANLVVSPGLAPTYNLHESLWAYLFRVYYPLTFGRGAFLLFFAGILYWTVLFIRHLIRKTKIDKTYLFLFISYAFFQASLIPLKLEGVGNRLLVLLPFFVLLTTAMIQHMNKHIRVKKLIIAILVIIVLFQITESFAWISTRIFPDPRETSSLWIQTHISKGTTIGIENTPIFQHIPDIALKEFYSLQYNEKMPTTYNYIAIDKTTQKLPDIVVVTDAIPTNKYWKTSDKTTLLRRLQKEHYVLTAQFTPDMRLFKYFYPLHRFYLGVVASPTDISVFTKKSVKSTN